MQKLLISLKEAFKRVSGKSILSEISFAVREGETTAILGPNGSGKSSLLKLLSGLSSLSSGVRTVVHPTDRNLVIGYAPDRFPKLRFTAREYLMSMGMIRGIPRNVLESRIEQLLRLFQLEEAADRETIHYSKGMLQKTNIMQAILQVPDVLLLDEPLSGLDADMRKQLMGVLFDLKAQGVSIVLTSHEKAFVELLADRIVTLRDGNIITDDLIIQDSVSRPQKRIKRIEFRLPADIANEWNELADMEGFISWEQLGSSYYAAAVLAVCSTPILKAILDAGGTVESVSDLVLKSERAR
ncbi:ATP-binding cassette domain-containing protein [Cohnella faecalis]|uniref:ATP-binding cassette domain-containing protein n=1 Tax=Cohnella faecalis TaxID=2315694 RepID=A0A398D0G7_9BACL|nr:ATP-binding cassette domain-containing protein [Cohnella faecalis]RIE04981.1 ATP-binding cassette domain-containing protein [Cohnella faecalis]